METSGFGKKLKMLRQDLLLTQEQLAAQLEKRGCSTTTKSAISQYENNKRFPDLKSLVIIADFFNVTTDYLISSSSDENETKLIFNFRCLGDKQKGMVVAYSKALCDSRLI